MASATPPRTTCAASWTISARSPVERPSGPRRLDDADAASGREHAPELEPGTGEQIAELLAGALLSAGDDQHVDVEQLAEVGRVAGTEDVLHDQHSPRRSHRVAAVAQDAERGLVLPVVQDVLHPVPAGVCRHAVEEAAAAHLATVGDIGEKSALRRRLDDLRLIEQDAKRAPVTTQDRSQQVAVRPADVDDRAERAEVVRARDPRVLGPG